MVRTATEADLDLIAPDSYIPRERLAQMAADGRILVAEHDGELVGFACLDYLVATKPFLALIRVLEPYRRQGIGRALLAHLEALCRARGHDVPYSSSQADEPAPQAWHRHVGFEEAGAISGFNDDGIDEVLFRKRLT
jgi:GNAT superfamily N-acetyltransferase